MCTRLIRFERRTSLHLAGWRLVAVAAGDDVQTGVLGSVPVSLSGVRGGPNEQQSFPMRHARSPCAEIAIGAAATALLLFGSIIYRPCPVRSVPSRPSVYCSSGRPLSPSATPSPYRLATR